MILFHDLPAYFCIGLEKTDEHCRAGHVGIACLLHVIQCLAICIRYISAQHRLAVFRRCRESVQTGLHQIDEVRLPDVQTLPDSIQPVILQHGHQDMLRGELCIVRRLCLCQSSHDDLLKCFCHLFNIHTFSPPVTRENNCHVTAQENIFLNLANGPLS